MKILYGVVGEGMGHATRSRVILNHLVKHHEVRIVVSGRAHAYLSRYFLDVIEIQGLHMAYDGNEVDRSRTFWEFLKGLPSMISENFEQFIKMGEEFKPDAVISDFESFAYTFAKHHDIPVFSIDNMQIISRCELEIAAPAGYEEDLQIAKALVKGKLPGCAHYLITTFFYPPIRKEHTSLFPPILRDEILDATPTTGEHLVVYQTSTTNEALLEILREVQVPCRVYGFRRNEKISELITLRDFSEEGFIKDLATCRGVLATGGFSLMGEAVFLGKPLLAVPVRKQFEQLLNALYLQQLGYGEYHEVLSADAVRGFMRNVDTYARTLRGYHQDRNQLILGKIDALLADVAAGRVPE